jgi:hypothetical protein
MSTHTLQVLFSLTIYRIHIGSRPPGCSDAGPPFRLRTSSLRAPVSTHLEQPLFPEWSSVSSNKTKEDNLIIDSAYIVVL